MSTEHLTPHTAALLARAERAEAKLNEVTTELIETMRQRDRAVALMEAWKGRAALASEESEAP